MKYIEVSHFEEKFAYLFRNHASIKNYRGLAEALRLKPSTVSGWKNGTMSTHPSSIPIQYIGLVCEHLGVTEEVMALDDLQQFTKSMVNDASLTRWDSLVLAAECSPRLRILSEQEVRARPGILIVARGIVEPADAEDDLPVFKAGESVMVRVDCEPGWHLALFCYDRVGWQRLHPTPRWVDTRTDGSFSYPRPRAGDARLGSVERLRFARLDFVFGPQTLAAVVTAHPLPEPIRLALNEGADLPATLQRLAVHLGQATTPSSLLLRRHYYVDA